MYRPNASPTLLDFMKKKHKKNTFDYKTHSYKAFKKFLACHEQRDEILRDTAKSLLDEKVLSLRTLAFKNHFFSDYANELAKLSGCIEVLPVHMRIKNKKYQQLFIELMLSLKEEGMLGNMKNTNLARMLTCTLDSKYSRHAMENRLKNKNPDYEFVGTVVKELIDKFEQLNK